MPYIKKERRYAAVEIAPKTPGELNWAITRLLQRYIGKDQSYTRFNDCLGALEGAKLEFYRRVAVPYESKKMVENGDVY